MPTATADRLALRDYQVEALERVAAAEARGVRAQLGVAATGLGKTIMYCALAQRMGSRALILEHRDELISQSVAKVREVWPGVEVGVVKGDRNEVDCHVVVASVQTLGRPNRLGKMLAAMDGSTLLGQAERFGLVVVDEAHHATAASYGRILQAFEAGGMDGPLLVGVTATPDRGDGKGLSDVFTEVVFSYDVLFGIRAGYLSDLRGLAVPLAQFDTTQVRTTAGDYNAGDAGRLLEQAHAPELIVKAWAEHAADRRTLVFTPTVALAEQVAAEYQHQGIAADYVHGGTELEARRRMLRDFSSGAIQVLCNCAVLTEGYDEPRVDCVVVARPTKSRAMYVQMVGRGTRRHPEKADCLILDVVGATADHSLLTIPSLFGLEKGYAKRAGDGSAGIGQLAAEQHDERKQLGLLSAREVALFESVRANQIAWVPLHRPGQARQFVRPLGKDQPTVVLAEVADGWTAGLRMPDGTKQVLMADVGMELAQGVAEDYVTKHTEPEHAHHHRADAPWRARPPSPKARAAAKRWRLAIDPDWNAGQLSDALDAHIARIKARKG